MKMKKLIMTFAALVMAVNMNAQRYLNDPDTPFEQGKMYVAASVTSASLSYTKSTGFNIGIGGRVGYLFIDNLMGLGEVSFMSLNDGDESIVELGAGARYYFDQVGIYVGAMAKYAHQKFIDETFDDFQPEAHVGYAFFLGRHVTLEPEAYYKHSFKSSDYSGFGLRIGLGIYF
jgi:hypothetical protein